RMGNARVTRGKVKVAYINPEKNIIGLKGAVPGPNGGLVIISTK
ncbi:50S ribosomal protein L3, partial [Candidatus Peregrinibacteria bacterium]|nr:50S ribosomal protein L3 [Candidatus Peregrinibacteria bacterium]